jgi:hypothetical protein
MEFVLAVVSVLARATSYLRHLGEPVRVVVLIIHVKGFKRRSPGTSMNLSAPLC